MLGVATGLRRIRTQPPARVRRWSVARPAGMPGLALPSSRWKRRVLRDRCRPARTRTSAPTSVLADGRRRARDRAEARREEDRAGGEAELARARRCAPWRPRGSAASNGNELCSSATVSPFTPAPATRPLSATVPLQSRRVGEQRSVTPLSARSVVNVAVPLRLIAGRVRRDHAPVDLRVRRQALERDPDRHAAARAGLERLARRAVAERRRRAPLHEPRRRGAVRGDPRAQARRRRRLLGDREARDRGDRRVDRRRRRS